MFSDKNMRTHCYYVILIVGLFSVFAFTACEASDKRTAAIEEPNVVVEPPKRLRLLFAGDAMCHTPQIRSARRKDYSLDFRDMFAGVKHHFDQADISIVNLETTISPNTHYSGYPCFSSPAEYADALAWLGTDIAVLANNHCCDNGARGINSTIAKLNTLGIAHTGVFNSEEELQRNEILRFERNGIKFSLINYTYGTNGNRIPRGCKVNLIDTVRMANVVKRASEGADCVIACMHWGYEYTHQPSREQHKVAKFLHRNGVDLVIGSHPHVVQPYVATDRQITIYSLGNFVSNQKKIDTDGGLLAEIEVEKGADSICRYSLRTIPIWVMYPGRRLVSSEPAEEVTMNKIQRARYERFVSSTKRLLEKSVKL